MKVLKNFSLILLNIVLAAILTILYWFLGGIFPWLSNHNIYTAILSCFLYVVLGFLFFSLKSSKYSGLYGVLEITLGLATFFVPFFLKLEIPSKLNIPEELLSQSLPSYIAFYLGIYLLVRGYESIYKNWKEKPSKYNLLFNTVFKKVEMLEKAKKNEQETSQILKNNEHLEKWKKFKRVTPVVLLFITGVIVSLLVFNTITDEDSLKDVISTGAQTIAALVGFVLAAYTFNHQFMWNARDSEDGTSEIIDETISKYFNYIMILSTATGITLIADLFILHFNALKNSQVKPTFYMIVGSLNVSIIIAAFFIALYIIRPIDIKEWARRLLEERMKEKDDKTELTVEIGEFIKTFITLEKNCREFLPKTDISQRHIGMGRIARILFEIKKE